MSIDEAINLFRGQSNLARALGVTQTAVWLWKRQGEIPEGRQYQIEILTGGALMAERPDPRLVRRKGRRKAA